MNGRPARGGYIYRGNGQLDDPETATCHGARGTVAGYGRHKRANERPCDSCRDAMNAYNRSRRKKWEEAPASLAADRRKRKARARAWASLQKLHPDEYQVLYRRELSRLHAEEKP